MMFQKKRYPTDVTTTQWLYIQRLLNTQQQDIPSGVTRGRKRSIDLRGVINAINYRWKTGCTWRMLPHDFPKWETVYTYFRQWRNQGLLPKLREVMILRKYSSLKEPKLPEENWKLASATLEKKESGWPKSEVPISRDAERIPTNDFIELENRQEKKLDPMGKELIGFQQTSDALR